MNTTVINIDSAQFTDAFADFKLSNFVDIKNVVSIEISDVSFFYTSNGNSLLTSTVNNGGAAGTAVTTSSMKYSNVLYRFLTINDYTNVIYNSSGTGSRGDYTTKLLRNNNKDVLEPYPREIKFNQPVNVSSLSFSWYLEDGTQAGDLPELINNPDAAGDERFTFTLTVKSLLNSTDKSYNEMFNFSPEVLQRLAYTKIIQDNDNKDMRQEEPIPDSNYVPSNNEPTPYNVLNNSNPQSLGAEYNSSTQNLNNQQQYLNNGNRINYNYNGFINNN